MGRVAPQLGRGKTSQRSASPGRARARKVAGSLGVPLGKDSVASVVLTRIKEALLRRTLKPGDFLPSETELTKTFGVSKSSVREAVKMLQAMGVVEVRRGQGTLVQAHPGAAYISPMIFQLIMESGYPEDLVELRLMFEPAFTVMAMRRATAEDLARIGQALERLEASVRSHTQVAEDDLAFHLAILRATGNRLVVRIGETIFQLFEPSISISMRHIPDRAVQDHRRIYQALCARDEVRLREAVLQSYDGWKESLHRTATAAGEASVETG
jgi:GntR family transcriptional regulator, transcriptional repressor for pyruvate dehydrogenase complex